MGSIVEERTNSVIGNKPYGGTSKGFRKSPAFFLNADKNKDNFIDLFNNVNSIINKTEADRKRGGNMLLVILCVVMRLLEVSGKYVGGFPAKEKPDNLVQKQLMRQKIRKRKRLKTGLGPGQGRGMTEDKHSPESDCNSNNVDSTASNTSSVDFIQDNSDYQWCLDYGYRESHHHASILSSLSASYEVGHYDDLARDIDSQLAQVDMEDFRAEDILPAMCCGDLQEESIALCKSEPLFSPVRETPMPGNISVDSLDCEQDMLLTCQANKDNYTIAFEGSTMMGTDSDYHDTGESGTSTYSSEGIGSSGSGSGCTRLSSCLRVAAQLKSQSLNANSLTMTNSDVAPFTTWSKLKTKPRHCRPLTHRHSNSNVLALKQSTISLPDLAGGLEHRLALGGCVKLYDVQNTSSSLASDSASNTNSGSSSLSCGGHQLKPQTQPQSQPQHFSLVRLFIKQRNSGMDQSAASDFNYPTTDVQSTTNTSRSLNEFECRETLCDNRQPTRRKKFNSNQLTNNNNSSAADDVTATKLWITDYEDSLTVDALRQHHLITEEAEDEEEEDEEESVERLTEGGQTDSVSVCSCDGSLSMSRAKFSINNNNSFERDDVRSPVSQLKRGTQTQTAQSSSSEAGVGTTSSSSLSDPTVARLRSSATQCPLHCHDKGMQTSASLQADAKPTTRQTTKNINDPKKPVYVLYPNYTLPDLEFLRDYPSDLEHIFLAPLRFTPNWTPPSTPPPPLSIPKVDSTKSPRPFSCAELDALRKKGFGHILDWESLTFLLPHDYYKLLQDVPEIKQYGAARMDHTKPLFCLSPTSSKSNPYDFAPFPNAQTTVNVSTSSSIATQPSSGYRGSSTLLTDSTTTSPCPQPNPNPNPLFVYRYDSISSEGGLSGGPPLPRRSISLSDAPPRPPLPKGILRNTTLENIKSRKNTVNKKRYSMFELGVDIDCDELMELDSNKRKSLPNPVAAAGGSGRKTTTADDLSSDEGVGVEWWGDSPRPPTPPTTHALRLQHLLEMSGSDHWDRHDVDNLRAQVSKFLSSQAGRKSVSFADKSESEVGQQGMTPPNSPQSSLSQRGYQCKLQVNLGDNVIREENENSVSIDNRFRFSDKTELVEAVCSAAQRLMSCDRQLIEDVSEQALNTLCPALYSLLSDGLKPSLETPFGEVANSVWQVIEASSQQGTMTRALNELVVKLNSEEVLTEGVIKFNAFIFGLLNVQGLDVWFSYLRTRESVLRKHYCEDALLLTACQGNAKSRSLTDRLLVALKSLTQEPFKLDPLFETRQLHHSLLQLGRVPVSPTHSSGSSSRGSWTLRKLVHSIQSNLGNAPSEEEELNNVAFQHQEVTSARPRSCVDSVGGFSVSDIASTVRKRWSGIHIGSKLANAFERLAPDDTEEEYTDSLETGMGPTNDSEPDSGETDVSGGKFRRLQMKWEMLSGKETPDNSTHTTPMASPVKSNIPRSRIPRPVTSPIRPQATQQTPSPAGSATSSRLPERPAMKKPLSIPSQLRKPNVNVNSRSRVMDPGVPLKARCRPSRADLPANKGGPAVRPSSLPYRTSTPSTPRPKDRRAASSSTVRKPAQDAAANHKYVVTLTHRLPSDSGHLAFNEGERLRLVLDVDETWLLCCRDQQKGLVPRSAVILVHN
ncbi:uncharacterized protein LOC111050470 isoform X3 [Nilaparvata lugens]|uniref:uncharacterized protein LOC111050470 isoform X3 n=1 Tax=Nilaparvata lugens TaxID=108931 RepID=UPI00193D1B79|nr:uncharacterized protein LOC111050470 isoform X3 [Nilaparvata lugens]